MAKGRKSRKGPRGTINEETTEKPRETNMLPKDNLPSACEFHNIADKRKSKHPVDKALTATERLKMKGDAKEEVHLSSPRTNQKKNASYSTQEELTTNEEEVTTLKPPIDYSSDDADVNAARREEKKKLRDQPETLKYEYSNQQDTAAKANVPSAVKFYTERANLWKRTIMGYPNVTVVQISEFRTLFLLQQTNCTFTIEFYGNGICRITGTDAVLLFKHIKDKIDS